MIVLMLGQALALSPDSTDPRAIMNAVENRDDGDRMTARLHITITDKAGRQRQRVLQSRRLDHEGATRQIMFFESPADVHNAGLLSFDWDDSAKDDDQWLYLPSLGKSTRISGADKSGSFMGTDLTYADMTRRDISDYDYAILQQDADVDGDNCWLIEARPRTEEEQAETGYIKSQVWVSKDKLIAVQSKAWVREGKKLKYSKFVDIKTVDGVLMPHKILVRTVKGGEVESQSAVVFSDVHFGVEEISAEDFSQRRLEQGI